MGSPLFKNATRAIRAALRLEMRQGQIGKILQAAERKFLRRGKASQYVKKLPTRLRGAMEPARLASLIDGGLPGLDRYTKRQAEKQLMEHVYKSLGPLGQMLQAFMRPNGKALTGSAEREISGVANFLRALGWGVIKPPDARKGRKDEIRAVTEAAEHLGFKLIPHRPTSVAIEAKAQPQPKPLPGWAERARALQNKPPEQRRALPDRDKTQRKTIDVDFGSGKTQRVRLTDPVLTGEMIKVVSSNVHSIGFEINHHSPRIGTLMVRFLQTQGASARGAKVAGPLYAYYNVPTDVFRRFQRAASKGKFVWDNLRIRGTVSGHKFDYSLQGIARGHVPRKATFSHEGELFVKRTFLGQHHKTGEKRLFMSKETALVRPWNGRPGNGRPSPPNRGRK
jgi:hypothetical protein